jgi:hypothetical protein
MDPAPLDADLQRPADGPFRVLPGQGLPLYVKVLDELPVGLKTLDQFRTESLHVLGRGRRLPVYGGHGRRGDTVQPEGHPTQTDVFDTGNFDLTLDAPAVYEGSVLRVQVP